MQLRLHRQGVAPVQSDKTWHMVVQGYATDASQAVHLKNSQRTNVFVSQHLIFLQGTAELTQQSIGRVAF